MSGLRISRNRSVHVIYTATRALRNKCDDCAAERPSIRPSSTCERRGFDTLLCNVARKFIISRSKF